MAHTLFTSESTSEGHPDKIADQISDAILDACLAQDPYSRVACETLVTTEFVLVAGEITTKAQVNYQEIVRHTIKKIGYGDCSLGFDYRSCNVMIAINKQSPDIAKGIHADSEGGFELGAGDQGLMFGYACEETPELMPYPIMLAHRIIRELQRMRHEKVLSYLRPDAKTQVTVEYNEFKKPVRLHTVVISTQHADNVAQQVIAADMKKMVEQIVPANFIDSNTVFYINPTGRFVIGGPAGDSGLTGRKIIVDTYGGMGRHGGGCFSGKDPTKVDRSATYMARYIAKNIVEAKIASRCEIQLAYVIGIPQPVSIRVDTFGTSHISENLIEEIIPLAFPLTPSGIIRALNLRRPIYFKTASGGHFGRHEEEFTWERTDRVDVLMQILQEKFII